MKREDATFKGTANPAAVLADQVRTFADGRATTILEAVVDPGDPPAIAQVLLDSQQVLATLDAAAPAILYLVAIPFSIEQLAMEAASDLSLAAEALPAPLAAHLRKLGAREGEICRARVQFVIGGVLHWSYASAPWLEKFEDAVEVAADQERVAVMAREHVAADARAGRIDALARLIVAEPAFSYGQVSSAKRVLLAEHMFPDEERGLLGDVVDRASQLHWLAQSGYVRTGP